jgi:replicative DNA helicase
MRAGPTGRVTPLREDPDWAPQPPSDVEIEQALLGAMLLNSVAYQRVAGFLRAEHFYVPVHQRIFGTIGKLIEQGVEANPITLHRLFDQDAALTEVGGALYLARLAEAAVTIIGAESYGRIILDLHARRELIAIGQEIVADAYRADLDNPADTQLDRATTRLFDLAEVSGISRRRASTAADAASRAINAASEAYRLDGAVAGVSSGIGPLDKIVGGFGGGDLVIVGGRTSHGKSTLATTIASAAAKRGQMVHLFSGEMTASQLASRIIASLSGISAGRQRRGSVEAGDWDALLAAHTQMASWPLLIDDGPMVLSRIRQQIRQVKRRQNTAIAIVDYLQQVSSSEDHSGDRNRNIEIGKITGALKATAQELDIPIIALSQLRRVDRDDKRPRIEDLRESGSIEQDADAVILVFRNELVIADAEPVMLPKEGDLDFQNRHAKWANALEASRGRAELIVAKNRYDRPGVARIRFSGARSEFYDPQDEP